MNQAIKVAVLGGGSFGTAIANILATNGHDTTLWMRSVEQAEICRCEKQNQRYLPGYQLDPRLSISSNLIESTQDASLIFISIPSNSFRSVIRDLAKIISSDAFIVSTAKGIEPDSFTLMSQILEQELPDNSVGVLSGPNFAKEIIQHHQTGTVIASKDEKLVQLVQLTLSSKTFRVYANRDPYGVELGGALKNIYAIVCGMAAALGAGHNTQAMLLTRSLAEMSRFAQKMGSDPMTFLGLAGVGDLILTCTSDLSRNYRVGFALGQGKKLDEIVQQLGQVAEGVNTLKQVKQKATELNVYMPLVSGLHAVLFEGRAIQDVALGLMTGEQNYDVEFLEKIMKIFILRHGQAEAYQANDSVRRLVDKGIDDTHQIISSNIQILSSVQKIVASPYVRAQETAAIAARLLSIESIVSTSLLEPEANLQSLFSFLEGFAETDILLVSHLPLVGVLANGFCGFKENRIQFNTSSLMGIECDFPANGIGHLFLERHV